jgi:N-acetylmuramoyl-L-alanine amidase
MRKLIVLDAGHGRYTAGKRCMKSIDPNETREWVLNSRMAGYVQEYLKAYDCQAMRVDDVTGVTDVSLSTRVARANNAKADLYVSIHHNAGINGGSGGGITVFTATNASSTSVKLAQAVYDATVAKTGLKGNRSKGLWTQNFTVISRTSMPAILGEFGFMDSTTDVPIILTDNFSRQCARGIADAIIQIADLQPVDGSGDGEGNNAPDPVDPTPSSWAKEAAAWAIEAGLIQGDGHGNYRWRESVTREEAAVLMYRFFKMLTD